MDTTKFLDSDLNAKGGKLLYYYSAIFSILLTLGTLVFALVNKVGILTILAFLPVSGYFIWQLTKTSLKKQTQNSNYFVSISARRNSFIFYLCIFAVLFGWALGAVTQKSASQTTSPVLFANRF